MWSSAEWVKQMLVWHVSSKRLGNEDKVPCLLKGEVKNTKRKSWGAHTQRYITLNIHTCTCTCSYMYINKYCTELYWKHDEIIFHKLYYNRWIINLTNPCWIIYVQFQTCSTVEPLYNEVLGTMKITLLYQVSRYIRVKIQRNIKSWDQQNDLVIIRGFCYIRPLYNGVPLYCIKQ